MARYNDLFHYEQGMCTAIQWNSLSVEAQQMYANIVGYAEFLEINLNGMKLFRVSQAFETIDPDTWETDKMSEVILSGDTKNLIESLEKNFSDKQPNPHRGYTLNFRQNVWRWSMQVCANANRASFDVDKFNPNWGLVPLFGHMIEVCWDSIQHSDTHQKDVYDALLAKKIPVLNCYAEKTV